MSSKNIIAFAHIEYSTGLAANKIEIWSVDGELQQTFGLRNEETESRRISNTQWNKDDSFIAMDLGRKMLVYNVRSNEIIKVHVPNNYCIADVCWKDETNILVTGNQLYTFYRVEIYTANVTEASDGVMLETVMWFDCKNYYPRLSTSKFWLQESGSILFFPKDGGLRVWSVKESDFVAEVRTDESPDWRVCNLLLTKTGDTLYHAGVIGHLAFGNTNGDVNVWKVNRNPNCHTVQLCKHSQFEITALRFNRDASVLASCDRNSITFWAVTTGTLLRRHIFRKPQLTHPISMEWSYKSDILVIVVDTDIRISK